MYNLTFTEDEINLIWAILTNSNIAGKSAPILTVIFNKIQESVNRVAMQQQRMRQEQEMQKAAAVQEAAPVQEEKTESF